MHEGDEDVGCDRGTVRGMLAANPRGEFVDILRALDLPECEPNGLCTLLLAISLGSLLVYGPWFGESTDLSLLGAQIQSNSSDCKQVCASLIVCLALV